MKVCFVVRSLFSQIPSYTTTHLAFEAYRRGHEVVYTTLNSFSCTDDMRVLATGVSFEDLEISNRFEWAKILQSGLAPKREVCLSDFDVVFLRYNPNEMDGEKERGKNPSIEFGRLLKLQGVMVVNDPGGLTKAASKMYLSSFPSDIRAQTLITRSTIKIKDFLKKLKGPAIIKPLSGFGGQDVFFVKDLKDININQIISSVSKNGYVMAQEYLPAVKKGDKRILLLNGYPIFVGKQPALYLRVSPKGEIRSNMHIGGRRKKTKLTENDVKIIESIRPKLLADGLYFVGIDIVGNKLLEINVFCPGGINNINELYGINVGRVVIQDLERQIRYSKAGIQFKRTRAIPKEISIQ